MENVSNKPLFVQPNKVKSGIVILDTEYYNNLLRAQQELKLLREIEKGEEDYKNGRVMTLQELREKLSKI